MFNFRAAVCFAYAALVLKLATFELELRKCALCAIHSDAVETFEMELRQALFSFMYPTHSMLVIFANIYM